MNFSSARKTRLGTADYVVDRVLRRSRPGELGIAFVAGPAT